MDRRPSELDPYPRVERDLGSVALWNRSSRRSHERRRRKAAARRNAPRQKGATLAAGAAVFASPLLGPVVGATAASSRPGATTAEVAERAAVSSEDTWLLSYGDTGDAVAAVQRNLAILEDGIFGPQTEGAVKDFQRLKGLAVTGVVDARTWAELFNSKVLFYDEGAAASSVQVAYEPPAPAPAPAADEDAPASANEFVDVAPEPAADPAPQGGPDLEDRVELRDEVSEPAPAPAPEAAPERPRATVPVSTGDGCTGQFSAPVDGTVTGTFGEDRGDHAHSGLDIAAPTGTTVRAAECGTVSVSGTQSGYGTMVCVRHAGETTTCYAHLSERSVALNEYVRAGQKIGEVGCTGSCTGPHVHFEVRENGRAQNPTQYLSSSRTATTANESAAIGGPTPEEQAQVFAKTDASPEPTPTGGVQAPVAADAAPAEIAEAVARTAVEAPAEAPVDAAADPAVGAEAVEAPAAAPAVEPAAEAPAPAPTEAPVEAAAPAPAVEPAVEAPAPEPVAETPAPEPAVEAPVEAPAPAPAPEPAVEAPVEAPAPAPAPEPAAAAPVEAPAAPVEAAAPAPAVEPVVEAPAPAPAAEAPAPAVEAPAPEPAVEAPAPAPAAEAPAAEPAVEAAPAAEAPAADPAATGGAVAPAG